jgi:16S rRNA (adenine1518-N6/adenine1519-N6)-dimethyltransferase
MSNVRFRGPRPRKALGQHFLRDTGVLADIANAVHQPEGGFVLEIGGGTGQLTEALLARDLDVVVVEVENRMVRHLQDRFSQVTRLAIIEADARDLDLAALNPNNRPFVVAGNLPYFAANPIIRRLLEGSPKPKEMVVMVQREVARELAAKPGHLSLLAISVLVYAEAEVLFDVPPTAFDPPPTVWSSVVRMTLRAEPIVPVAEIEDFFSFVSKTFRNPRKQIHNGLKMPPELASEALRCADIDPMRRPETLTVPEWLALMHACERAYQDV